MTADEVAADTMVVAAAASRAACRMSATRASDRSGIPGGAVYSVSACAASDTPARSPLITAVCMATASA